MDYNKTVHLPQTDFPMRASLPKREPDMLKEMHDHDLYHKMVARNEGKPEKIIEKMVEGRIVKFYKEVCLLEQAFVKDADVSVGKMIEQKAKGLNIVRFTRYKMGDGLEKKVNDLAAEVAEQIGSMQK